MSISTVVNDIETNIKAMTPSYRPAIGFEVASKQAPIEALPNSASSTVRSFQVRFGRVLDVSSFNCDGYTRKIEMLVIVRYHVGLFGGEGWFEANLMSTSDASQIVKLILTPPIGTISSTNEGFEFDSDSELQQSDEDENVFFRVLTFTVDGAF